MTHRFITWRISKYGKARTFAINYRLAPQHPFPAAVEDALAAYLYLLEPPADAGFRPVDPKHIVIAGDSAGGGLTMATLLAIRDARLPLPAGGVGISPWVDLTHSLPSILSNVATDYLPEDGFEHLPSSALDFDRLPKKQRDAETEAAAVVTVTDAETPQLKRMQYYAPNQVLKVPYASPIFDLKGFTGLPPLLLQTGACERLRDEAIYTGHKASLHYPSAPSLTTLPPTQVTLEVYADMPHVFQMFVSTPQAATSFSRIGEFVQHVVAPSENRPIFERFDVDTKGNAVKSPIRVMEKEEWNLWESRLALSLSEKVKEAEKAGMIVKGVPSSVGEEAGMKQKNKL
ncbi:hypothetical protein BC936DRAFT_141752 [Jimgerdemannia flammicorona]|uniref:Alpha/beta hydrolase fold-3 domain-containing protein n=1 Tax=Jimgerdemannia flammicorona TaxID=994334 RepID=A0A433A1Q3_9FUNG|nr:hypothetical protein BC936DRAFT_141752 [Jimgerdemannia flammicorona]